MKGIKWVQEWTAVKNGKTINEYTVEYYSRKTARYQDGTLPMSVLDFIMNTPCKTTYIKQEFGPYKGTVTKQTIYQ